MSQTHYFLLLIFFFFFPSLALSFPATDLIRSTCNGTSFYDLCVSCLSRDPASPTADIKGLSAIAVISAADNATATSSYISTLASKPSIDPAFKSVLNVCLTKYNYAADALRRALDALGDDNYDYALTFVSAAAEYPNVCRRLFQQQQQKLKYPPELARREIFG